MSIVTVLTDFGTDNEFVGVMKGVIYGIAPDARIVDRPLRKYERARNLKRLQGIEGESEWVDQMSLVDAHRKRRYIRT